jgi:hypothetical protein
MIVLIFLMLMVFSSAVYRVLERPLDDFKSENISDPLLAMWFTFETISTLGYGELYPLTYFGRTISVFTYLVGAIVLSLVIVQLQSVSELNNNERQVFEHVSVSNSAAEFINSAIRFYVIRRKYPPNDPRISIQNLKVKRLKAIFRSQRSIALSLDFSLSDSIKRLKSQVMLSKIQLNLCKRELDRCISILKDHY